jgi:hypothetical protein
LLYSPVGDKNIVSPVGEYNSLIRQI